jgi:type II secretion system protein C
MKHLFKPAYFRILMAVLVLLLVIKIVWFLVTSAWLPKHGIDQPLDDGVKALYYRVRLTPNDAPPPKRTVPKRVVREGGSINDLKLQAIYHAQDATVVTVTYRGKSKVLSKGEDINGFVLEGAGRDYATFSKEGKSYKVQLDKGKTQAASGRSRQVQAVAKSTPGNAKKGEITDAGDRKVVDKSVIDYYRKNFKEIGRNIGIAESRQGGALDGFKVTFIRRGSDFEKLGLKRNDVIKAVNGQPVNSYKAAMDIYRKVGTMDNMTLTINRGNEEMELEYEVN